MGWQEKGGHTRRGSVTSEMVLVGEKEMNACKKNNNDNT